MEPENKTGSVVLEDAYRKAAHLMQKDGELEIDDGAKVSLGDDNGAYVAAWVWVSDVDAGIHTCAGCGRVAVNPPDAGDWREDSEDNELCPACAEKAEDDQPAPFAMRQLLVDSGEHAAILAALRQVGATTLADHLDNHWSDYEPVCDCDDRSWYGEEHDSACAMEGKRE